MRFNYADGRMPISMEKDGQTYYLAYDQVGSLRAVSDSAGNVVKQIEYDTFGYILTDTDPLFEIPFGFAGGLHDQHTGLVRFGYRDYDPDTGRWTAKDPILFAGGDTDLYGYVLNNPVNWVDPWGLLKRGDAGHLNWYSNASSATNQPSSGPGGMSTDIFTPEQENAIRDFVETANDYVVNGIPPGTQIPDPRINALLQYYQIVMGYADMLGDKVEDWVKNLFKDDEDDECN
ncbi:MAG: RHS repeat-associated core domain-containing protein [Desulfobacteraceae bacterium]|nr:RHS repeat-associated core domain-containing protein [Desulfobacteraceae bacterium]